jgi:hypothetical protein
MIKLIILSFFSLSNLACSQVDKNFHKETFAVYVEAKTEDEFVTSGEFGDIVLLNLYDHTKLRITNDKFYDSEPSISHDGGKIIYMSNRYYGDSDPRFIGVGPLGGIYIHNLENNAVSDITDKLRNDKKEIVKIFRWGKEDESIFYLRNGSEIIEYNFNTNEKRIIYTSPSSEIYLWDFLLLPNFNSIVLRQGIKSSFNRHILIYNIETEEKVEIDSSDFMELYSTYNDTSFLFYTRGKIYLYKLGDNTIEYLFDSKIKDDINVGQCFRLDEKLFLILGTIKDKSWLLKFDIATKHIEYISDGKKDVKFLDLYLRKNN